MEPGYTAPPHSRMDSSDSSVKYPLAAGAGGMAGAAATGPEMRQTGMAYQNIPSEQYWAESNSGGYRGYAPTQTTGSGNRKWKIAAIVLAVIAVIAIVVGIVVSQVTKKSSNGGSNSSAGSSGNGSSAVLTGDDPSAFDKDPNLHQSFWAMAYTPQEAILPNCNVQLANVTRDIQVNIRRL